MRFGIIGNGFVGNATSLLSCADNECIIYDIDPSKCNPLNTTLNDIYSCDIIFIAVPTPMEKNGLCHTNIITDIINDMSDHININRSIIVLRSTIPPGLSDTLGCYFMPEFLTEKNYKNDFVHNTHWIFGLKDDLVYASQNTKYKRLIHNLFNNAYINNKIMYNNIHFIPNKDAEMVKLFRNTFLSTKVSFCNEIHEFCSQKNINYNNVITYATLDRRITDSHTGVPGHDGKHGFGGTCFPKDCNNLQYEMNKIGMKSYIITNVLKRNTEKDRPEQDWTLQTNRAVI
jgi:nucleotide sugar dehydrogenase